MGLRVPSKLQRKERRDLHHVSSINHKLFLDADRLGNWDHRDRGPLSICSPSPRLRMEPCPGPWRRYQPVEPRGIPMHHIPSSPYTSPTHEGSLLTVGTS